MTIEYGLWEDNATSVMLDPAYAEMLADLGIDVMSVMLNTCNARLSGPPWQLAYTLDTIKKYHSNLKANGIKLELTVWPRPDKDQITLLYTGVKPFVEALELEVLDNDCEENWLPRHLKGFANMKEAGKYLAKMERDLGVKEIRGNSYPDHREFNPDLSSFLCEADGVCAQGYAVRNRKNPDGTPNLIGWDDPLGPGAMQTHSITKMKRLNKPMCMGLPHYDQIFPGHTGMESIQVQFNTSKAAGVSRFRGWSARWVRKNSYNADFFHWLKGHK